MASNTYQDWRQTLDTSWNIPLFLVVTLVAGLSMAIAMMVLPLEIAMALPMLLVGAYVCIVKIEWALVILVFMVYTNLSDVLIEEHGAPSVAKLFVPALLVVILARWPLFNESPKGWTHPIPYLMIWVGVGFAGMLYAADSEETQRLVIVLLKNTLIAITIILLLYRGETLHKALWALIIAGLFLGTIGVAQHIRGDFTNSYWGFGRASVHQIIGRTSDFRISGPIGDSNTYGQIMLVIIPIALNRFANERNLVLKSLAGWAAVASTLTVIFTFSRGAFIGLVAMGVLMVLTYTRRPSTILAVLLLMIIVIQVVPPEYTERITTITNAIPGFSDEPVTESSLRGRTSEVTAAWLMFRDHPFLGVGLGNYNEHYLEYSSSLGLDDRREDRSAHSLYLETMAEQGIVGLFALFAMVGAMLYFVSYARNELSASAKYDYSSMVTAFGIGLIGYLVAATFLHDAYPRFFWLLFGICFALPEVVKYESRYYE